MAIEPFGDELDEAQSGDDGAEPNDPFSERTECLILRLRRCDREKNVNRHSLA